MYKHESTNWGHYFYFSYWRWDRHFTWSSEPHEGLAICSRAEVEPSFLSHFKTLSIGPNPRPPTLQSSAPPTDLILLRLRLSLNKIVLQWNVEPRYRVVQQQ